MDMRVRKTKRSIFNAFLELRSKKPLEKIRVGELCQLAEINKSTFYTHYQDIYDLSEAIEEEALQSCLNIPHPEYVLSCMEGFIRELYQAYFAQERLLEILFSGSRERLLTERIAENVIRMVSGQYPEQARDPAFQAMLAYQVYGSIYAFHVMKQYGEEAALSVIVKLAGTRGIAEAEQKNKTEYGERKTYEE
ncbi:MAG: TetR/AcrR family transcriptional regulator [Eubacteriales bacterium]|nr:TetR/AcrR family transcriptional regulator [Eubacteriales bacterium]